MARGSRATSVAWISTSYGFNGDLAYFEQIFGEFQRRFPRTIIPVVEGWDTGRYLALPLRAVLRFRLVGVERSRAGTSYRSVVRIPSLLTAWRLARLPARTFIVIEFTPVAVLALLIALVTGRRRVLLVESDPAYRGAPSRPAVTRLKRWICRLPHVIMVSNEIGKRWLVETVGTPPERIIVGPYLTSDPCAARPDTPPDHPVGIGVGAGPTEPDDDRPVSLLFVNSVNDRKGLVQLLEALAQVPDSAPSWRLDVVGDGDQLEAMRERADRPDLAGRVRFHGRVRYCDVGAFYQAADVVVCPSLADYRSLGGFEAVNSGRAVVVSVHDGAHHEITAHHRPSWSVDPLDRPAFTRLLTDVVGNRAMVSAVRRGLVAPAPEFTLSAIGDNLERAVTLAQRTR